MRNFVLVVILAACDVGFSSNRGTPGSGFGGGPGPTPTPPITNKVCHYIPDETSESAFTDCDIIVIQAKKINVDVEIHSSAKGSSIDRVCDTLQGDLQILRSAQERYSRLDPKSTEAIRYKVIIDNALIRLKPYNEQLKTIGKVTFSTSGLNTIKDRLASIYSDKNITLASNNYVDVRFEVRESLVKEETRYFAVQSTGLTRIGEATQPEGVIAVYDLNLVSDSASFDVQGTYMFYCEQIQNTNLTKSIENLISNFIEVSQYVTYEQDGQQVTRIISK